MRAKATLTANLDITALIDRALENGDAVNIILDSGLFSGHKKSIPLYRLYHPLKKKGRQALLLPIIKRIIERHPEFASTISLENAGLIFQLLNPQTETKKAEIITQLCGPDSIPAQMEAISILAGLMEIEPLYQRIATHALEHLPTIAIGAGQTANMHWCEKIAKKNPDNWNIFAQGAGMTCNREWCTQLTEKDPALKAMIALGAGQTENMEWCEQVAGTDPDKWKLIAEGAGYTYNLEWCTQLTKKDPALNASIALGAGQTENMEWCEQVAGTDPDKWKLIAEGAGFTYNLEWCAQLTKKDPALNASIALSAGQTENIAWCEQVAETDQNKWHHIAVGAGQTEHLAWCTQLTEKDPALKAMIALGAGQTANMDWCQTIAGVDPALKAMIALGAGQTANMDWCEQIAGTDPDKWKLIAEGAGSSYNLEWCHTIVKENPKIWQYMAIGAGQTANMDWCEQIAEDNPHKWYFVAQGAGSICNREWCTQLTDQGPGLITGMAIGALLHNNIDIGLFTLTTAHKQRFYPNLIKKLITTATDHRREATLMELLRTAPHPLEITSTDPLRVMPNRTATLRNNYRDFFKMCSNSGQYTLENPLSMVTFYNQFPTELLAGGDESPPKGNHLKSAKICQSIISIREENGCSSLTAEQLVHAAYENTPLARRTPLVFFSALYHSSFRHDSQSISNPGLPSKILSPVLAVLVEHAIPYLENRQYKKNLLLAQWRQKERDTLRAQKQLATRRACKLKENEPVCTVMLALFGTHILPFLTTNWTHEQSLQLQPMFEKKYAATQNLEHKIKKQFKIQATCIAYLLGLNKLTIRTAADLSAKDTRLIADIFFHKLSKDFIEKYLEKTKGFFAKLLHGTSRSRAKKFLEETNPLNITEDNYTQFSTFMKEIADTHRDAIKQDLSAETIKMTTASANLRRASAYQLLPLIEAGTSSTPLRPLVDSYLILQSFYKSTTDTSVPFSRSTADRLLFGSPLKGTRERIVEARTPTKREKELKNASKITVLANFERDLQAWAFYP